MKTKLFLMYILILLPLASSGQKFNILEYLNLPEDSITEKIKLNGLSYFNSLSENNEKIIHVRGDVNSSNFIRRLNANISLNDSISYMITIYVDKRQIKYLRHHLGIENTRPTYSPVFLSYGERNYYYSEVDEIKYIHIEIYNSTSFRRTHDVTIETFPKVNEISQYMELLEPQIPPLPRGKNKILNYVFGAWVAVIIESEHESQLHQYRGELLATKNDSITLYNEGYETTLCFKDVKFIGIYTHDNNPGKWASFTVLSLVPNFISALVQSEYAIEFLTLGIPVAAVGLINILVEVGKPYPVKYFPGEIQNIEDLNMYARFPQGIPDNLNTFSKESQ